MFCVKNYTNYIILFNTQIYLYTCEIYYMTSIILIFFIFKFEEFIW